MSCLFRSAILDCERVSSVDILALHRVQRGLRLELRDGLRSFREKSPPGSATPRHKSEEASYKHQAWPEAQEKFLRFGIPADGSRCCRQTLGRGARWGVGYLYVSWICPASEPALKRMTNG